MRGRAILVAAIGLLLLTAASAAPPTETRYVAQLRQATAGVDASLTELSGLSATSPGLADAGRRLVDAAGASCRTLRTYQNATTRYGTDEEYQLVQKLQRQLADGRARYGLLGGVATAQPTRKQRSAAEQLLRDYARSVAQSEVARWVHDERLADILTSGNLKEVRAGLEREVARRIDASARSLSERALGLSLSLNEPLKTQVRRQADQAALTWLARTAFRWDPSGLAIQLVGVPVVRFLRGELEEAFRDHKHVQARTDRTVRGFAANAAELQKLIDSAESAPLARVRTLLSRSQRALDATVYLKSDLRKQGRGELTAALSTGEAQLAAKMREARAAFLLDSALARSNVRRTADDVCKLHGEILQITRKLGTSQPKGDRIVGDWTAAGGVMRVTGSGGSYEGRLVKTYTFCRSGSVPLGQAEWKLSRVSANNYKGTVRYYRVSDCTYIGDATNATWKYDPSADTLTACSSSPNPSYPGGGCETEKRVKR